MSLAHVLRCYYKSIWLSSAYFILWSSLLDENTRAKPCYFIATASQMAWCEEWQLVGWLVTFIKRVNWTNSHRGFDTMAAAYTKHCPGNIINFNKAQSLGRQQ